MKFERNPKYTTISIYAIIVLVVSMLCFQALQNIGMLYGLIDKIIGFITPILYGVVFAFLLNPLLRKIEGPLLGRFLGDRFKPATKRIFSLILTYLTAIFLVALFFWLVIPQLIGSLISIFGNVPYYWQQLAILSDNIIIWLEDFLTANTATDTSQIANELGTVILNSINGLITTLYTFLEQAITTLVSLTASLTTGIINLILGVIVSLYILMDREKLFAQSKKICRAAFPDAIYRLLYDIAMDVNRIFSGFVIGKVIDSIIIGILCMIGMSIFGFQYAVLISVIVGVTNVIPYFGPFIGAVPGFILLVISNPMDALWFLVFIVLLQQLDGNVIGPKILGDTIGLSPLWIIFSIMLFSGLLGILGMFIGVPLFAILYSLIKRLTAFLLARKGQSTNTRDYASDSNPLIK